MIGVRMGQASSHLDVESERVSADAIRRLWIILFMMPGAQGSTMSS